MNRSLSPIRGTHNDNRMPTLRLALRGDDDLHPPGKLALPPTHETGNSLGMAVLDYPYLDLVQERLNACLDHKKRIKTLRKQWRRRGLPPADMLELIGLENTCSAARALELLHVRLAEGTNSLTHEPQPARRELMPANKFRTGLG